MNTQMIKAAAIQFNHREGDKRYNLSRIEYFCQEAAKAGTDIVVCPEMCITGYWHVHELEEAAIRELAEPVPDGPSTKRLIELATEHRCILGAGLIELSADGRLFNTYVVAHPDGHFDSHRKLHCFINRAFSSGDSFTVFDTHLGCKVGVLICYDNNIVENARITALMGADILLAPHQTGGCDSKSPQAMGLIEPELWNNRESNSAAIEAEFLGPKGREWLMRWLPARAHDNGMFVVFSNGVGVDDNEVRTGNAMVLDCYGRTIVESRSIDDDMVIGEIDLQMLDNCTGRRWMRGRRPELYAKIAKQSGKEVEPYTARFQ